MNILEKFVLNDEDTQFDKNRREEYEIYGISKSGVILERDVNNPKQILFHVSNGLKVIDNFFDVEDGSFFRKGTDTFWKHYRNCDDYEYSKAAKLLSPEEIIRVVKEYVYLHQPNFVSTTLMGWDKTLGVLQDPNFCKTRAMLDDKKEYSITKRFDKVEIKVIKNPTAGVNNENLELVASFLLFEKMYSNAQVFYDLKRQIYESIFGKISDGKLLQYLQLKKELEDFIEHS